MYAVLPDEEIVHLCIFTKAHLCLLNQLYIQLNKLNGASTLFLFKTETKLKRIVRSLCSFNQLIWPII